MRILEAAHSLGHSGAMALFRSVYHQGFFWAGMLKDCKRVVAQCSTCVQNNVGRSGYLPAQASLAALPWWTIAIDLMSLEKSSQGNVAALVVVDIATRFVVLRPLRSKKATDVAAALWDVFGHYLIPHTIVSDGGPEFSADLMTALKDNLGIHWRFTAAYNPRANGVAERFVGVSKDTMRKVLHGRRAEWETAIPAVMLSINTRVSAITSSTPASLMLGRECRKMGSLPLDGLEARAGDAALWESLRQRWEDMHEFVYPAVALSAATRAGKRNAQLDASRTIQAPHQPGTLIMARDQQRDGTLDARWAGPFTVVEQHGNSYSVKDDDGEELGRLVPHHDTKLATHVDRGDGDTFHAIENITDHSRRKGKEILYKVRWKNYGKEHDSWVAAGDVTVSAIDECWAGVYRMTKRRGRRKHKSQRLRQHQHGSNASARRHHSIGGPAQKPTHEASTNPAATSGTRRGGSELRIEESAASERKGGKQANSAETGTGTRTRAEPIEDSAAE